MHMGISSTLMFFNTKYLIFILVTTDISMSVVSSSNTLRFQTLKVKHGSFL